MPNTVHLEAVPKKRGKEKERNGSLYLASQELEGCP